MLVLDSFQQLNKNVTNMSFSFHKLFLTNNELSIYKLLLKIEKFKYFIHLTFGYVDVDLYYVRHRSYLSHNILNDYGIKCLVTCG